MKFLRKKLFGTIVSLYGQEERKERVWEGQEETYGLTDRQIDRQIDTQTDTHTDRHTDRQTNTQTDGQTDRQTHRQTEV